MALAIVWVGDPSRHATPYHQGDVVDVYGDDVTPGRKELACENFAFVELPGPREDWLQLKGESLDAGLRRTSRLDVFDGDAAALDRARDHARRLVLSKHAAGEAVKPKA